MPRYARLLALIVLGMLVASGPAFAQTIIDYDMDNDGYIDVTNLAQLNAIRYDLNGDGIVTFIFQAVTLADTTHYKAAFPNHDTTSTGRMGCPSGTCIGYELLNDLDFDSDSDGDVDANDHSGNYWNSGAGWIPIGSLRTFVYLGNFKGNGHTINNLFINRSTQFTGLFGTIYEGVIETLGVTNANVRGGTRTGILVGYNVAGKLVACYTTGKVEGGNNTGGLIGEQESGERLSIGIYSSYSTAQVVGTSRHGAVGGLLGNRSGGDVINSYAIGRVITTNTRAIQIGGLVGATSSTGSGSVTDSYWDTSTSGQRISAAGTGHSTSDLQRPTGYTGIYANWNSDLDGQPGNDNPWAFGATNQYPVLKYADMDSTEQFNTQPSIVPLALMPSTISETGAMSTVTATLVRSLSAATTITVRPVAGAYTVGSDSTITIAAGSTANASDTVVITSVDNTKDEPDRNVPIAGVARNSQVEGILTYVTLTLTDDDPEPTVTLTPNPMSISEGAVSTVTASLSRPSSAWTTITVRPVAGAYTVITQSQSPGVTDSTITIFAGATTPVWDWVVIRAVNNTRDEPDRNVPMSSVAHNDQGVGSVTGTLTLADDDAAPTVTMIVSPASIFETVEVSTVTATLSHTSSAATTITVSVTPVSPAAAGDYTLSTPATLTVAAGQTMSTGTVTITTVNNAVATGNKTVTVGSTPSNSVGTGSVTPATLTIVDDEVALVTLVLSPASITENAEVSTITAILDRPATAATTITVSAMAVSPAVAGDFTLSGTTTLTVATSMTTSTGTVTITSVNDTTDAPDKEVTVSATVAGGNLASLLSSETLTITDDEAAPDVTLTPNPASISENGALSTVTATLSHKSSAITTITVRPVTGAYTVGSDSTITIAAGSTANASDNVVITAVDNPRDAPDRDVTLSSVANNDQGAGSVTGTLTLTDDDAAPTVTMVVAPASIAENGGVSTVTATLNRTSSEATTITVTVAPVSPAVATDYSLSAATTLTVAAGQTMSTGTVTITAVNNAQATGNKTVTVSSTVANSVGTGSVTDATLTITDDDLPLVTLVLSPASIAENAQVSTITATLDRTATVAATVTVAATPVAPAVAGDFTLSTATTLTFAANVTTSTGTVTITSVNDTTDAPDKRVTVSATVTGGNMAVLSSNVTLTITDDEAAPTVTLTPNPASISENVGVSTVTATLSHKSSAITTITVRPVAGAYTVGSNSTITIAAGSTADASDTVVITAVDNTRDAPDRDVTVSGVARNDQGVGSVTGTVTLTDNDDPPTVTMILSDASIAENGGVSTVTARLSHTSSDPTTITVDPTPVLPAVAADYTLSTPATLTVAAGQTTSTGTVTITTVDNAVVLGSNKTVTVSSTVGNSVGAGSVTAATLTITDDDVPLVTLVLTPASITENAQVSTVTATLDRAATVATTITVSATEVAPAVAGDFTLSGTTTLTVAASATTSTGTVTITSVNDTTDAPDKRVTVSATVTGGNMASAPADVTLTITDDEDAPTVALTLAPTSIAENGGVSTITATLSHSSSAITTITVRPVAGAYTVGSDSTITIAAGSTANAADTVEITAVDNPIHAPNNDVSVSVAVSNDQGAGSVTGTALTITEDEAAPDVTMVLSPASISENGGISTVTATLSHASSEATTITVSHTPVLPAVAGDYSLSTPATLTVAAGQTMSTGTVTITTVNNNVATGNKTVTVSSTLTNSVGTGSVTAATLTITDDDVAQVTLVLTPASITENAQVSTITATLDRTASTAATVTVSATAVAPAVAGDFTLSTATTLTFAASATTSTGTVTITSVNDTTDAPDKSVTVSATVTGGNMASLSSNVTLTITDDEAAPTVTLTPNPASISENGAVSTVTATLSHKSSAITTITVRPVVGAYTVGSDSTITIAVGSTANASDTVVITAVDNPRDEPNRDVTVSSVARNTQGVGSVTGTVTLTDDDDPPDVTLSASPQTFSENGGVAMVSATLSHPSSAATTVTVAAVTNVYTVSSNNTIIIAADATTSTDAVTITGVDNDIDAADNATTVTGAMTNSQGTGSVTGVSVTITDDDAPPMLSISSPSVVEDNDLMFTVRLNAESGKVVTVAYADAGTGSATSGTDYTTLTAGTLTFAAGTTSRTIAVSVSDDGDDEPNETVVVTLSNPVNATFDGGATSLTGTGTIIDDDGMPALSIGSPSVIEGATNATLTFRVYLIPAHTAEVTVAYADAGTGSATSGTDYTALTAGTLTFAAGVTSQTFDVSVLDDSMDEPNETVAVRLSNPNGAIFYGSAATLTGTGTIIDDDAVMLSIDSPSVAEGAAGATPTLRFTVSLSSAIASQVTVAYADAGTGSAESGTDYDALAAGTLTFAVGETSKSIDISVIGDAAVEPDETVVVTLSNAVNAALAVTTGTGTITNDDQAPTDPTEPEPDPDTEPTFTEAVDPQSYRQDKAIEPLTLPVAIDGNGDLTYSLTGLPEGLTFDAETRELSGTPTTAIEKAIYTLTATDEDGDENTLSFFLTIVANMAPSFGDSIVTAQAYTRKQEIMSLTLPQVIGGDAPLTYALTPDLPEGLNFDAETLIVSGTPLEATDETTYTLTATDSDGDEATLRFTLSVMTDPIPTFGDTTVAAQVYMQHREIASLALPQASGGDEPLTYALSPALPEGLTFDAETLTVSGTPIKAMDETTYTLTATDGNGDAAHLTFTLEVPDLVPAFGDTTIAAQSYLVNQEIASLMLPQASSGDGMLVYILLPFLPDGLNFDLTTRTLSGMPTEAKAQATYTLSALDADGDVASLPFTLEVSLPSPDFNGDGNVNFADFLIFASKFDSRLGQERYDARCDLNGDGQIDSADFFIFADNFGSSG